MVVSLWLVLLDIGCEMTGAGGGGGYYVPDISLKSMYSKLIGCFYLGLFCVGSV